MGRVREAWIDESRGFAMLLIVFGHICTEDFARSFVWSFHVPLFMIIAGLTYRPKASFLGEVSHRARRLLIPYLVWGGTALLLFSALGPLVMRLIGREGMDADLLVNLFGLLWANGKGHLLDFYRPIWFLPMLFSAYLLAWIVLCVIDFLSKHCGYRLLWVLVFAVSIFSGCWALAPLIEAVVMPFSLETAATLLPFLLLGIYLQEKPMRVPGKSVCVTFAACAIALCLAMDASGVNSTNWYIEDVFGNRLVFLVVALTVSLAVLRLSKRHNRFGLFSYIGSHTMSILVLHKYPLMTIQLALGMTHHNELMESAIFSGLVSLGVALLCAEIEDRLINPVCPLALGKEN